MRRADSFLLVSHLLLLLLALGINPAVSVLRRRLEGDGEADEGNEDPGTEDQDDGGTKEDDQRTSSSGGIIQSWLQTLQYPWSTGGSHSKTGAEVFQITFSDAQAKSPDLNHLDISKITQQNGITGNPKNRYVWSMALDDNEDLYIGILNQDFVFANASDFIISVIRAPWGQKWNAAVDAALRQWSGTPIFENEGAQIYRYSTAGHYFELVHQTDPDHIGFRKMVNYQGNIYAGSTNGPEGPYDADPYDFSIYEEGTGAKIFTNEGGGNNFEVLDDEGNLDSYDKSIRSMCVSSYSGRLWVGTETWKCAKIVSYYRDPTTNETSWTKKEMEGDDCTLSVSSCRDLGDGKVLFGTWAQLGYNVYVLDEKNNDSLTKLNTPQWWYHISCGVMELRVFKGHLYVGVLSFVRGFALVRTSKLDDLANLQKEDWELITGNGFGREQKEQLGGHLSGNEYTWSSAEANGVYFIGTVNLVPRGITFKKGVNEPIGHAQLWATEDGENWKMIQSDEFKDAPHMYGFRTMAVTKDQRKLYIGSAANMYLPAPV